MKYNIEGDFGSPLQPAANPNGILEHLLTSVLAVLVLAVICCAIYPAVVWGLTQAVFHDKANGSLLTDKDGKVVGSRLIGQSFADAKYFHPRPSAAGSGYDGTASGGSNLGPTSAKLINGTTKPTTRPDPAGGDPRPGPDAVDYDGIKLRVLLYCQENDIPVEASQPLKSFQDDKGNYDPVKLIKAFNDDKRPLTIAPKQPLPPDAVTASGSGLDPHISPANALLQAPRVAKARGMTLEDVKRLVGRHTDGRDVGILGEPGVNVVTLNLALDGAAKH